MSVPTTSSTSTDGGLRMDWVYRLFDVMLASFGKKFVDQWDSVDQEKLAKHWSAKLSGYSAEELKRGVESLDALTFPPTLPEFMKLCRPPVDPVAAYHEAVAGVIARERGERGNWSHPAIFWAAVKVSAHDLKNTTFSQIRNRWEAALEAEMRAGTWVDIPEPVLSLPAPAGRAADPLAAAAVIEQAQKVAANDRTDHLAWAKKIMERVKRGDKSINHIAARMAREALEERKHSAA